MRAYVTTVTDAVTLLVDSDNKNRTVYLNVVGNKILAIGGSSVTYATGLLIAKHAAPLEIFVPTGERIYARCDTGETDDVRVLTPDAD
jgi:hypothetical protein